MLSLRAISIGPSPAFQRARIRSARSCFFWEPVGFAKLLPPCVITVGCASEVNFLTRHFERANDEFSGPAARLRQGALRTASHRVLAWPGAARRLVVLAEVVDYFHHDLAVDLVVVTDLLHEVDVDQANTVTSGFAVTPPRTHHCAQAVRWSFTP